MAEFLGYLIPGILVGLTYSLIALGYVIIYKSSGVFNLATGQIAIFGAFVAWQATTQWHLHIVLAIFVTLVACAILGAAIDRLVVRPLIGQPLFAMVLATLGLSVVLDALIVLVWGHNWRTLPQIFPGESFIVWGVGVSIEYLWAGGLALVMGAILAGIFQYTKEGLAMRASADDQLCAQSLGMSVSRVFRFSWIIASITLGMAGVLLCMIAKLHTSIALIALKVLTVVLLGGLESVAGALVAGPLVGAIEFLAAGYLDPLVGGGLREVIPYVFAILIILFMPYGFFGWKRIERV